MKAIDKVLIEMMYLAPVGYYALMLNTDHFTLEQHEHYIKATYRNRCNIYGANGHLKLSIPLQKGKHQHALIKDIQISYDFGWQYIHWQSICSAYRRSPWFEYYESELQAFYHKPYDFLWDFNEQLMHWVMDKIGIEKEKLEFTKEFIGRGVEKEVFDLRSTLVPQKSKLLQIEGFTSPRYTQVFEPRLGFIPDLSIIDLLFAEGKRTKEILEASMTDSTIKSS